MAYYNQDQDQEQDPNQPAQTGPQSSVITGSGGSSSNAPAGANPAPDKSGNFVGLQTYLNANKPQAAKLGDQASGIVTSSANDARNAVTGLNNEFNQKVDQGTVNNDQAALGIVGSGAENLTPEQRAQLKKQYSANYSGPNALSDIGSYSDALNKSNLANQNIQSAGTEAGRMGLVSQINSAPRSRGDTLFDNMLLQKGPGRDKLLDVSAQNQDVKNLLPSAQTAAQTKVGAVDDPNTPDINEATGAKGTTEKTKNDTFKSVQDALNAWRSGFDPRLAEAQNTGTQQAVTKDLGEIGQGDPYLNDETFSQLGINPNTRIFRRDLSSYLNPFSPTDVNAANVATPEDYARYSALADLAGIQDPYLNQANAGQAGTAPKFSINQQKLNADLKADQDAYDNEWNNTRGLIGGSQYLPRSGEGVDPALKNATMAELVGPNWRPTLEQNGQWGPFQQMIDQFQNERGYNNLIKSMFQKSNDTVPPGSVRAWI